MDFNMFGKNKILPPTFGDGQMLEVKSIFPTLQGEGIYVGVPAVFIRLGGCNLACNFCDTDFEDFATTTLPQIIAKTSKLAQNKSGKRVINLVVITGGEPLRQNISPLCESLLANGFLVQIETNGTIYRELPKNMDIICSPKNTSGNYAQIRADLLPNITAFKFIISVNNQKYNHVPEIGQSEYNTIVFVQPMDEGDAAKNAANQKLAVEICMQNGYRLSLQTHKILGIE
jgi:organic radical activating enzyme